MEEELPRIDGGEEVLPELRYQEKAQKAEEQETAHEDLAVFEALTEQWVYAAWSDSKACSKRP